MSRFLMFGALLVLVSCTRKIDGAQAEKAMTDYFQANVFPVEKVSCPKSFKAEKDAAFVCTVKFTGGDEFKVDAVVTETTKEGARYAYVINEPLFNPKPTAAWITEELIKQVGIEPKVDCGAPRKPAADEKCTVTDPKGITNTVALKLAPDGKPLSWEVVAK